MHYLLIAVVVLVGLAALVWLIGLIFALTSGWRDGIQDVRQDYERKYRR
jgi:hypothetical protein